MAPPVRMYDYKFLDFISGHQKIRSVWNVLRITWKPSNNTFDTVKNQTMITFSMLAFCDYGFYTSGSFSIYLIHV